MAAAAKAEDGEGAGISGEYKRPDAKAALKIFKDEIAPKNAHMATIKGDLSDPYKRIKDECHFPRKVLDFLMQLDDMEEAKRDHWLLAMSLGLNELKLFMPRDLVTEAEGTAGDSVIPTGARANMKLVGVDDDDEPEGDDDFEEASEEELAQQEGRGEKPLHERMKALSDTADEPKPGTGDAAIKKMKEKAATATVN